MYFSCQRSQRSNLLLLCGVYVFVFDAIGEGNTIPAGVTIVRNRGFVGPVG